MNLLLKLRVVVWYERAKRLTPIPTPTKMPSPIPTPTLTPALNHDSSPSSISIYPSLWQYMLL